MTRWLLVLVLAIALCGCGERPRVPVVPYEQPIGLVVVPF